MTFEPTTPCGVAGPSFELPAFPTPADFDVLRGAVAERCAAGERESTLGCDGLGRFDDAVARGLIRVLRAARAGGGELALVVARDDVRERLHAYALDRIFRLAVPGDRPPCTPPPRPVRVRLRRAAAGTLAVLAALALGTPPRATAAAAAPLDVVRAVVARSDGGASSYRARVSVVLRLRSFPFLTQHLDGTTYYRRPGSFAVDFDRVPSYAKGFDKLCSDIDDPSSWESRFRLSDGGEVPVDGRVDVVVRLVQKVRGMIDHEDVAIDPARDRIDRMTWYYYNGGVITMAQQFREVAGYSVLAAQRASIRIPFVDAVAVATYDGYETNVAIDDRVFERQDR